MSLRVKGDFRLMMTPATPYIVDMTAKRDGAIVTNAAELTALREISRNTLYFSFR